MSVQSTDILRAGNGGVVDTVVDVSSWETLVTRMQDKRGDQDSKKAEAERLGIQWERSAGDNRSARYIIDHNPLLRDLGNQEGIRDKLKEQVGDFENDSDAAFRAVQVLEHIEKFDSDGKRIAAKGVGNGRIDGITPNGQVRHGTEAGRLKDFGKYGFSSLQGNLADAKAASQDTGLREEAAALGIAWERPAGDSRSAREIIDDTPLLKNLGNQSGVKEMLKDRVGDFEHDADAAYRAAQVLNHVEQFDGDGKDLSGKKIGNDKIDGFTSSGEARHGTEAGRLQDFGKYGFDALKGKMANRASIGDDAELRGQAEALGIEWTLPAGDDRSAKEIIDDSPRLRNLGNQSGVKEMLKDRVGDFEHDADAAYRAVQVLEHVEWFDASGKQQSGHDIGNGKIDGFTSSDEARHGTEAGRLQDFGKYGFDALKGDLRDRARDAGGTQARERAEALGIVWERPRDDDRSAGEIIDDSPLLKNLDNRSGVRDMLKSQVGDFEHDPDAAYRAAQVLEHIERRDADGGWVEGDNVGNDEIDGFTDSGEARHGTEAGRLQDFGREGFDALKGELVDDSDAANDEAAREQAEALGIVWERPPGDHRSAEEILDDSLLLKSLGNESGVKSMLKTRVGDYEHDADAAYRAVQVLDHIERFDESGEIVASKDVDNDQIDGFTSSGEARHGTEAGRLQDFGKYGFTSLKGEFVDRDAVNDDEQARAQAQALGIVWERPEDDSRTAKEIIDANPLLRDLGNQEGIKDMLKDRVGDFEHDADAAYRAVQVLEHVERYDSDGKSPSDRTAGNGKIDGFTGSGEVEHGTEAGRLKDFGKYGFDALEGDMSGELDLSPEDLPPIENEEEAREQAQALGITWTRPENDVRSAKEIIEDSPLLRDLGNQSGVKDRLKERVGDFEKDPDAAYRAAQVLDHIEKFDSDGERVVAGSVDDGRINGFTSSGDARHGTEAGRLQDFGKYGFESLKGKAPDRAAVGNDDEAREYAETVGIEWTLPKDDKRSARDIIDGTPLLKNLGNQSSVKEMLKDRVGDYEHDADAAYRAKQVLERIESYDSAGGYQSGDANGNGRIDGFTSSGEARHGTEAGRLQDFGKYGFASLQGESGKYRDYLEANPEADDTSKRLVSYATLLYENYDAINDATGGGEFVTRADIQEFKEKTPYMSDELERALDFWGQPGSFEYLETSLDKARYGADGLLAKKDVSNWIEKDAPTDAGTAVQYLIRAANDNAVSGIDTQQFDGEVFEHPEKYSAKEKAAVLRDLEQSYDLVLMGKGAGMWDESHIVTKLKDRAGVGDDPDALLTDIQQHIDLLSSDPDVEAFKEKQNATALTDLLDGDPVLKQAVTETYENDIRSGNALDKLWEEKASTDDASGRSPAAEALGEFLQMGRSYQAALGLDDTAALQAAVKSSSHNGDFQSYYEDTMVSGDRLTELLENNSVEEAISAFTLEVSVFNSTLDPSFTQNFDDKMNENFTEIVQKNAFKDASFDDLEAAFGVDGGDELDEEKLRKIIETIKSENPEAIVNDDGSIPTVDQIITAFRGEWDALRQGTKVLDKSGFLSNDDSSKRAYGSGVMHAVSGLVLGGIVIAKGSENAGNLTDREISDIVGGSIISADLITEGGLKGYGKYLKDAKMPMAEGEMKAMLEARQQSLSTAGNVATTLGGLASAAMGAYAIFDGVKMIREGDTLGGGLSLTSGSLGTLAGIALTAEGGLGVAGIAVPRLISLTAGAAGLAGAVLGLGSLFAFVAIEQSEQSSRENDYADLLGEHVEKYGIDGK